MALIHCDGFDTYTDHTLKWEDTIVLVGAIQSTGGRDGRGCWKGDAGKLTKTITAADSVIVGFALMTPVDPGGLGVAAIGTGATDLIRIEYNDPEFSLVHGQSNTVLGTTSGAGVMAGQWCYLELKFKVSSSISTGDVILRVNTIEKINVTAGTSTTWSGATTINKVHLGSLSGVLNRFVAYIDDVVILTPDEGFWGDVVVEGRLPSSTGGVSQWSPTGSTPNYNCVDDTDGDTTYISTDVSSGRDTYGFGNLNQAALAIKAVQVSVMGKSLNANPIGIKPTFRQGGVDYDQDRIALTQSYAMELARYKLNPATGQPWTPSEIAALEAGITLTV